VVLRAPGLQDSTRDVAGEDHKGLSRSRAPRRRTIPAEDQLTVVEISAEIRRRAAVLAWLGHRLRFRETQGRGCVLKRRNGAGFGVRVTELRRLRSAQRIRHYPCQSMPASGRCGGGGAGSDDCGAVDVAQVAQSAEAARNAVRPANRGAARRRRKG